MRLAEARHVPPAGTSSGSQYRAIPVLMRSSVAGASGTARSPIRVPVNDQSITAAAGSASGSTTRFLQRTFGHR
ncbi:hypothetical protein [Actinomadura atramentaria]|uniref:hypothetical protein n=1 Tax=Actinomadura atramentaria TaxID=1990 RepID=UPI001969CB1C